MDIFKDSSLTINFLPCFSITVSVCAGVRAITSIPSFQHLSENRAVICMCVIAVITVINLRGVKESGRLFAVPTYAYIVGVASLVVFGLTKSYLGWFGGVDPILFSRFAEEARAEGLMQAGGILTTFVLLKGFASGAVALTGVEAICDGVPAFKKPSPVNASKTLMYMAFILGTLFFGVSLLASRLHPIPLEVGETVFSQMSHQVFGGGPIYYGFQIATAMILMLAANTAYADFTRLSSIIAKDGFLPRQLANRGDRLVFSNGVIILGLAAIFLVWFFDGTETALIPLYAVGVFTSLTLSQSGMVRYQLKRENRNLVGAGISLLGALTTLVVLGVVAITKFMSGTGFRISQPG